MDEETEARGKRSCPEAQGRPHRMRTHTQALDFESSTFLSYRPLPRFTVGLVRSSRLEAETAVGCVC